MKIIKRVSACHFSFDFIYEGTVTHVFIPKQPNDQSITLDFLLQSEIENDLKSFKDRYLDGCWNSDVFWRMVVAESRLIERKFNGSLYCISLLIKAIEEMESILKEREENE